jgi:hypothetical protein
MVFLERFDKLTNIRLCGSPLDLEFTHELFRDFGLSHALLRKLQNHRSCEIEAEHLPVENVEYGCTVGAVGRADVLRDRENTLPLVFWLSWRKIRNAI